MIDVSLFEKHIVDYKVPHLGEPLLLVPFGCVHWDSDNCAHDIFQEFCDWGAAQKNALFFGMGDYFDFLSSSERRTLRTGTVHDSTIITLEQMQQERVKQFVEKTAFMRGRLIGLIDGNHFGFFMDGTTTTQRMITEYNYETKRGKKVAVQGAVMAKYLGVLAAVRLKLIIDEYRMTIPVDIVAFHGKTAAQTRGGSLNSVAKLALVADANIYLAGHSHDLVSGKEQRLRLVSQKGGLYVKHREIAYVRTGSFLKSYVEGKRSYVVPKAYSPAVLGAPYVSITVNRSKSEQTKLGRTLKLKLNVTI